MYVCVYVCMYVRYVCMYVCMLVRTMYACILYVMHCDSINVLELFVKI